MPRLPAKRKAERPAGLIPAVDRLLSGPLPAVEPAAEPERRQQLVEQKLRLVDTLINTAR